MLHETDDQGRGREEDVVIEELLLTSHRLLYWCRSVLLEVSSAMVIGLQQDVHGWVTFEEKEIVLGTFFLLLLLYEIVYNNQVQHDVQYFSLTFNNSQSK